MARALLLTETGDGVSTAVEDIAPERFLERLPEGDVTLRVSHSTLNYKDGMVVQGLGRLVRDYPHVPGIDFVGTVEESDHPAWKPGDQAILTGWRVGEVHWGGYAELARVKGDWLVPLPAGLEPRHAMAIGTAGFTAMLAVMALEEHGLEPGEERPVLVTGAAGGVGSVAVMLLSRLGFKVAALTGRPEQADYLRDLGANEIVERASLEEPFKKPLDRETWAGCVDAAGGRILARVLTQMRYGGSLAAVGLAAGSELPTTVIPFLLRGVNLLGIDSVMCPKRRRLIAWSRLAELLPAERLDAVTARTVGLEDLPQLSSDILDGKVRGRVIVEPSR